MTTSPHISVQFCEMRSRLKNVAIYPNYTRAWPQGGSMRPSACARSGHKKTRFVNIAVIQGCHNADYFTSIRQIPQVRHYLLLILYINLISDGIANTAM